MHQMDFNRRPYDVLEFKKKEFFRSLFISVSCDKIWTHALWI